MAGPVRQTFDINALESYVERNVPEIKTPIDVKQFGFGQSNPTYQLTGLDGKRYVMRKKPPGKLLSQTAHKVDREYRVIHALQNTDVPVPKVYCLCEDASVIGTAFYIMEFLDGRVFVDSSLPDASPSERMAMWRSAVETLAKLHRLNYKTIGLETYGKPNGFYNRQIKTFSILNKTQGDALDKETGVPVGAIPRFQEMTTFFSDPKQQPKDRGTLIHGDYHFSNLMFHKTEPYVIGLLDWEMSTIGHPLSDIVNLTAPWVSATSPESVGSSTESAPFRPNATPGLPTRDQCMQWYTDISGWDPREEAGWADAFAGYRMAIIIQGIAARYAVRQASSPKAKESGERLLPSSRWAWELVQRFKSQQSSGRSKI